MDKFFLSSRCNLIKLKLLKISDFAKLYPPTEKPKKGYVIRFYYGYDKETKKVFKTDEYLNLDYFFKPDNEYQRQQNKESNKQAQQILEALRTANNENRYPIAKTNPLSVKENCQQ